jgi:hypothetical protein
MKSLESRISSLEKQTNMGDGRPQLGPATKRLMVSIIVQGASNSELEGMVSDPAREQIFRDVASEEMNRRLAARDAEALESPRPTDEDGGSSVPTDQGFPEPPVRETSEPPRPRALAI